MKKYKAINSWTVTIDIVEILNETKLFVTYEDKAGVKHKESKESMCHKYCETFDEAKSWLMGYAELAIRNYQSKVDSWKSMKQKINNMHEPK